MSHFMLFIKSIVKVINICNMRVMAAFLGCLTCYELVDGSSGFFESDSNVPRVMRVGAARHLSACKRNTHPAGPCCSPTMESS